MARVCVGLLGADQLLAVVLGFGLDLQGVLRHQHTQRQGRGGRNAVDKFGLHFGALVKMWEKKRYILDVVVGDKYIRVTIKEEWA